MIIYKKKKPSTIFDLTKAVIAGKRDFCRPRSQLSQRGRKEQSHRFLSLPNSASLQKNIQLIRQRLFHKSVKAYATMRTGIMGSKSLALLDSDSR